jgi:hypothetical protein
MNRVNLLVIVGLIGAVPLFCGCQEPAVAHAEHEHPAEVAPIDGSEVSRITLTDHALKRLDVQTGTVTEEKSPRGEVTQIAVPYSSLIYDPQGNTWVYTNPQPRVFVREAIDVDFIQGDLAYLTKGPQPGTAVATVGVAELYGTEFEVGH